MNAPTPAQSIALHAIASGRGATSSPATGGWFAHDRRRLLVQISSMMARVLEIDGLVRREGKPVRLVLTDAGREWVESGT